MTTAGKQRDSRTENAGELEQFVLLVVEVEGTRMIHMLEVMQGSEEKEGLENITRGRREKPGSGGEEEATVRKA